jgi:hypothetical protein
MNWKVVSYLSLLGLVMAFATVYLIPEQAEHYIWILIFAGGGFVIARKAGKKFFLNGFVPGIMYTTLAIAVRTCLYSRYAALNPSIRLRDAKILASGVTPKTAMLLSAPIIAVFTGIVQGSFALIISKFTGKGQK